MVVAREKKLAAAETIRTAAAAAQEGANEAASYGAAAAWTVELGLRTVAVARWNDLAAKQKELKSRAVAEAGLEALLLADVAA